MVTKKRVALCCVFDVDTIVCALMNMTNSETDIQLYMFNPFVPNLAILRDPAVPHTPDIKIALRTCC
jgi:hypothetical protein